MLDGQNLFDACLSDVSHHEWGFDETVHRLIEGKKIPAMIIVGVDHAGKDRAREFLPYKDFFVGNPDMDEPAGKRFRISLTSEKLVTPLVASNCHHLWLMEYGHRPLLYGGVATLYALMAEAERIGLTVYPKARRCGSAWANLCATRIR